MLLNIKHPLFFFLLKAIAIWLIWTLLYKVVFKEEEINDPITLIEAKITAQVFVWMGYDVRLSDNFVTKYRNIEGEDKAIRTKQYILVNGKPIIGIATACNGLELFAMFFGFLIAFGGRKRFFEFLIFGLLSIFLLNNIRIFIIAWISMFSREYADFHHHYTFMFIVYGYIIWLWHRWTIIQAPSNENDSEK